MTFKEKALLRIERMIDIEESALADAIEFDDADEAKEQKVFIRVLELVHRRIAALKEEEPK